MKVEIAKENLWYLRELIRERVWQMENCPNPSVWGKSPMVGRLIYKSIVQAQKRAFGHDWGADESYFPIKKKSNESNKARQARD
jgi:hypothetical protein